MSLMSTFCTIDDSPKPPALHWGRGAVGPGPVDPTFPGFSMTKKGVAIVDDMDFNSFSSSWTLKSFIQLTW